MVFQLNFSSNTSEWKMCTLLSIFKTRQVGKTVLILEVKGLKGLFRSKNSRAALTRPIQEEKVRYLPFAWGGKQKDGSTWFFLEILGAVESSLGQLAALVRYPLPVRLADYKADSSLSISVLLLLQVGPAYLRARQPTERSVTIRGQQSENIPQFIQCS